MIALPTAAQIETLTSKGVNSWIESLQTGALNYPVEETARALAALYNRRQAYLELTQSASAKFSEQQAAISDATAEIQAQAVQAEAELADARAARELIEQSQAETVAEIEAVSEALEQMAEVQRAAMDELERVLAASDSPLNAWKQSPLTATKSNEDIKQELDAMFAPIFADFQTSNRRPPQQQPKPQPVQPSPQKQVYTPAYLRQTVHRPKTEQELMANSLATIGVSVLMFLGCGGIVLHSWLSNPQVLSAPVASVNLSEPPPTVQPTPAPTPQPQFYSPQLQASVEQARALDATTRLSWMSFCQQTNGAQGYGAVEQQFCTAIKYI